MTLLYDTSVLIAALVRSHQHHDRTRPWWNAVRDGTVELVVSAHTIGELFTYFTGVREIAMRPEEAAELIRANVASRGRVRTLPANGYLRLLSKLTNELDVKGGAVYDATHAEVARREKVDGILTLNPRHFERVWPDDTDRILDPRTTQPPQTETTDT